MASSGMPMPSTMWRGTCGVLTIVVTMLSATGLVDAKPTHRTYPKAADSSIAPESLFEAEPRPGPAVMRDPEILSRGEMLSLVKKYAAKISDALVDGERHRERAVRDRDSIKLSCIQDRLSNMKLMKKLSDERLAATDRATIRADELNLRHEFRGVELAYQRVIELHRELMECVGEHLEVTGDSRAGDADPTAISVETPRIDRPTAASPYR
jgi:hypothetical protein